MRAALYECDVMHRRLKPEQKRFDYRIFMLSVDLDAIPTPTFLSHNRFNLYSLNDADHIDLGHPGGIKANLLAWLAGQKIEVPNDVKVRLVTLPRILGYGFNPVSFFYLNKADGTPLFAVAEVVNTYREMKLYLVDQDGAEIWKKRIAKDFYVSPFSDPGDAFDFRLGLPREKFRVTINNLTENEVTLTSTVRGSARDLTSLRLVAYAFKYPLLSLKIITLIHWQALKLWLNKVRFYKKSDRPEAQKEVLRPHSSLTKKP
ncbi:MAG: DUF1365 domain-containing protein [Akkermansiaceae bacterium]|jgi:DUF1365 family protein|nr:DUF1365 domain-containing protein [Akkermansiaceae bacterium]